MIDVAGKMLPAFLIHATAHLYGENDFTFLKTLTRTWMFTASVAMLRQEVFYTAK